MFLVPSSFRAFDPYLQTLLLRVSLSRLGGKHRQLACQVGDPASSSASSMATFAFSIMAPPQGATFVFGSWVCVANGSGGFDSHLTNLPVLKIITLEDSNKLARSDDRGIMLLPDLAKEIEAKLEDNSSSTRTQINLKPKPTWVGTPLAQPIFGLRNASSTYKQMIRSIYENSLDHLFCAENHSVTASREAPVFDVYLDPVESSQDSLDFITNAVGKNPTRVLPKSYSGRTT